MRHEGAAEVIQVKQREGRRKEEGGEENELERARNRERGREGEKLSPMNSCAFRI